MTKAIKFKMIFVFCWGVFLSCTFLHSGTVSNARETKKYNLSVCAVFKDEAKFLKEWIEYHRLVGVDHFYLYNNNSHDQYMAVLRKYIQEGVVTLIDWPYELNDINEENDPILAMSTEVTAYENAARFRAVRDTKWLVFVNLDEYLLSPSTGSLREILVKYDRYPGVILKRDHYDSAPGGMFIKRNLVIESSSMVAAPRENIIKSVEKMIFKPDQYKHFQWAPYQCIFKDDQQAVTLSKQEMRINRYLNRGIEYLFSGKGSLQVDTRALTQEEVREIRGNGHLDQDHAIDRFVPTLRKKMGMTG